MSLPWRITLLGGLRAETEGHVLTRFATYKAGALLACLAFYRDRAHPRESLMAMLWPDSEEKAARNSLSVALSSLRHQLEPPGTPAGTVLRADRHSLGLTAAVTTDVAAFEAGLAAADQADSPAARLLRLSDTLALYRGRLLPGYYEDWIGPEQERLDGRYFDASGRLIALLEAQGDLASALAHARQAAAVDPLREEAQERLIRLLAATGQPGWALRQYNELEHRLEEELGVEPAAPLRALARQIERQSGVSLPALPVGPTSGLLRPVEAADVPVPGRPVTRTVLLAEVALDPETGAEAGLQTARDRSRLALGDVVARHGGQIVQETEAGLTALFASARAALQAAVAGQQALRREERPAETVPVRVRMALYTADLEPGEGGSLGPAVRQRAGRLLGAAHEGQVLCSEVTAGLLGSDLPDGARLEDRGLFRLGGVPERLFEVTYAGMPAERFPAPQAPAGTEPRLPLRLTRFFGRQREVAELTDQLLSPDVRLVTLTGPGGTGKTRLALEVADLIAERFAGAVWFVPLADLSDPGLMAGALREAMRLPASPRDPEDQVVEALSRQPALLLLDNLEHLVEGGAEVVQALLERVASLTVLATSRQVLGLASEREVALSPLPTPAGPDTPERLSAYDSVRLFIDRAQAVRPDFQVTSRNAPAVAELVDHLEGIPLAIELAAARAQVLTPGQMLAQVADRFGLLATRRRDVQERHRTLRGAIEWSFRLLAPELQRFFARLSVFRGGWSVEAAEQVCEEPLALDWLAQLRECSLVLAEETDDGMRFRMLETLREYAAEQVPGTERKSLRRRHVQAVLRVFYQPEKADPRWQQRLERDLDNLRAAFAFTQEDPAGGPLGLQLMSLGASGWFLEMSGHWQESLQMIERALAHGAGAPLERTGFVRLQQGHLLVRMRRREEARPILEQVLEEARGSGWRDLEALTLWNLAILGDREHAQSALRLYREMDHPWGVPKTLLEVGMLSLKRGDLPGAREAFEEARRRFQQAGYRSDESHALLCLGHLAMAEENVEEAIRHYGESLAISREYNNRPHIACNLAGLGRARAMIGDVEQAGLLLEEGRTMLQEIGDAPGVEAVARLLKDLDEGSVAGGRWKGPLLLFGEAPS